MIGIHLVGYTSGLKSVGRDNVHMAVMSSFGGLMTGGEMNLSAKKKFLSFRVAFLIWLYSALKSSVQLLGVNCRTTVAFEAFEKD